MAGKVEMKQSFRVEGFEVSGDAAAQLIKAANDIRMSLTAFIVDPNESVAKIIKAFGEEDTAKANAFFKQLREELHSANILLKAFGIL